jgi:hypothetical protein
MLAITSTSKSCRPRPPPPACIAPHAPRGHLLSVAPIYRAPSPPCQMHPRALGSRTFGEAALGIVGLGWIGHVRRVIGKASRTGARVAISDARPTGVRSGFSSEHA